MLFCLSSSLIFSVWPFVCSQQKRRSILIILEIMIPNLNIWCKDRCDLESFKGRIGEVRGGVKKGVFQYGDRTPVRTTCQVHSRLILDISPRGDLYLRYSAPQSLFGFLTHSALV